MKRFVLALAGLAALVFFGFTIFFFVAGGQGVISAHDNDGDRAVNNATVTFGGWMTNTPIDRFPNNANTQFPRLLNHHRLTPEIAKIKAGGTVNFIVGGFHVVTVYDDGTKPTDINTTILVPGPRPGPPIINDANRRIYRGLDPTLLPAILAQDRVETVQFDRPGKYLVICAVLPHFQEGMFGYVKVVRNDDDDDERESSTTKTMNHGQ
ncbi:MAG: hypothetical protein HOP17_07295 [Acidobacteria bacterium]|nr:hypothetical protein [Acidobacteriota bacterium]